MIKTPKQPQWCRSDIFIVNSELISHLFFSVSTVEFEHVNVCWNGLFLVHFLTLYYHAALVPIVVFQYLFISLSFACTGKMLFVKWKGLSEEWSIS